MCLSHYAKYMPFIFALTASFFFALSTFLSKLIGTGILSDAVHPLQVTHSRFAFGFVATSSFYLIFGKQKIRRPNLRLHILRATFGWIGVSIMFTSVVHIPITDAVALIFMNPIFAMIFAIFILKEKIGRYRWLAAVVAFGGATILVRPDGNQINFISLFCLIGAAAFGLEIVLIKLLSGKEHPLQILIFSNAIGTCLASVPMFYLAILPSPLQLFLLVSVGCSMLIGQLLFLLAMQKTDASVIAPLIYFTVVFVTTLDILFLKVYPDIWSYYGATLILVAGLFIGFRESQQLRRSSEMQ